MTDPMTTPPLDLTALKEIATTATPGEWSIENITSTDPRDRIGPFLVYSETQNADGDLPTIVGSPDDGIPFADARHIAAFDPPAVLQLLDRLEAAERDLAAVTASRDGWQTRTEAAEKKVAAVRGLATGLRDWPQEPDSPAYVTHMLNGSRATAMDILTALDGGA